MAANVEPTEKQRDDAALWLVRRTGRTLTQAEEKQLAEWLARDPLHRKAYDEAEELWIELGAPAWRLAQASCPRKGFGFSLRSHLASLAARLFATGFPSFRRNLGTSERKISDLPQGSKFELIP